MDAQQLPWLVLVAKHGVFMTAIGPFGTEFEARRWARNTYGRRTGWQVAVEQVTSPKTVPVPDHSRSPHPSAGGMAQVTPLRHATT